MRATRRAMLLAGLPQLAPAAKHPVLRAGPLQARLGSHGGLKELRYERVVLSDAACGEGCPELVLGGRTFRCDQPVRSRQSGQEAVFEYRVEHLDVTYTVSLRELPDTSAVLTQRISWASRQRYSGPVGLNLPRNLKLPAQSRRLFVPTREGIARRDPVTDSDRPTWLYAMAGGSGESTKLRLAAPVLSESSASGNLRLTLCSEPGFSTSFQVAGSSSPGRFGWTHTSGGDAGSTTVRTFYTVIHRGSDRRAYESLYDTALAGVRPGPAWLHDITLVNYDYLSKNGRGWFADIDALARLIPLKERHRVVSTLHGWYDFVGRYAFNPATKSLDRSWTAFPNVGSPAFLAHARGPKSLTATHWGWRKILDGLRPVEMSVEDLRRRMRYARERGFRCLLYFGDGLNAGDGLAGIHEPEKVLKWGGWVGPETAGKTYAQNPLHPGVRSFFKNYLRALLEEFGREVDGFVWDETFHIGAGQMGTDAVPGYADEAMMSLVDELRSATERHNSELAFLTSDIVGPSYQAPYALVAHGAYQDSMSGFHYWPYGLFPNLRNSLWSCNWYHQSTWNRNEQAVATYELPVAISNGYGDDLGVAEMNAEQVGRMMTLFRKLGDRRLELSWLERDGGATTFKGRPVPRA